MNLDYPTILLFIVIMNIFNIALFAYEYFFHHKKWYLSTFIVGILFQTIAIILIDLRNRIPFLYTIQISNFFFISSFSISTFGLISFDGKIRKNILWLFVLFTLIFYFSFLLLAEDNIIRIVIQIVACAFFYTIGAFSLITNKKKYKFAIIISIALIIFAVFQLNRAFIIYNFEEPYYFMKGSTIDNWYLVIALFIVSTVRIGFIMLLKEMDENTILLKNRKIERDKLKLEELNSTKDKLFSIIAHDLRSPFNGILGFSELLIENVKNFEVEKSEEYLGYINSSAQSTLVLLDNLLHWAKAQIGQINYNPKKLILSSIIQEIIKLSNSSAVAKEISLIYNKANEIEIYADEEMLKIVLRNLISNAIKFTKRGGKVNVLAKKGRNQVEISIYDNGIGMNKKTIDKLFKIETNETSLGTANEKGSGLGLILCKELVEKQGGKVWAVSELGKGSCFKFTLPFVK